MTDLLINRQPDRQKKIKEVVEQFAQKTANMDIVTNLPLTHHQLQLLKQIHVLAVNCALNVPEVLRDPRKISYYANQELKLGVAALLMTHVLVNHLSKAKYTEEFIVEHLAVYTNTEGTQKRVDLTEIEEKIFKAAIYDEIVFDWIIYRTPGNRGIKSLSDEKTFAQGLKNFYKGSSPISEFARFERKYFEEKQAKKKNDKESAQKAFRNTFVQQVAQAVAKEILQKQDPMIIAQSLFSDQNKNYEAEIENILNQMAIPSNLENENTSQSKDLSLFDPSLQNTLQQKEQDADLLEIMANIRAVKERE